MSLEHNPIFQLAKDVEDGLISLDEAVQRVSSPDFLKKVKKKHFRPLADHEMADLLHGDPQSLPRELFLLAFLCAARIKMRKGMQGYFAALYLFVLVYENQETEAQEFLQQARTAARDAPSLKMIEALLSKLEILFGTGMNVSQHPIPPQKSVRRQATTYKDFLKQAGIGNKNLDKSQISRATINFGEAMFLAADGKYGDALRLAQQAVVAADRHKIVVFQTLGRLLLGIIYRQQGNVRETLAVLNEAKSIGGNSERRTQFQVSMELVANYRDMGDFEKALEILEKEREVLTGDQNSLRSAEHAFRLATVLRRTGQFKAAKDNLHTALQRFGESKLHLNVMECQGELGWLRLNEGLYEEAIEIFRALKETYAPIMRQEISWHCSRGIGFAHFMLGNPKESRKAYLEAVDVLEDMRQAVLYDNNRISFLESKHDEYDKVIDCSLELKDYATALKYLERLKSRNLAEILQGRHITPKGASPEELEEYSRLHYEVRLCEQRLREEQEKTGFGLSWEQFHEAKERLHECVRKLQAKDPTFDPEQLIRISVEEMLELPEDTDTAIVELYPMKNKTVAFVILKNKGIEESTVIIDDYNLDRLSGDVDSTKEKDRIESVLRRLYETLYVPLSSLLDTVKKIVFIPYGNFHLLPLHAMFTEAGGVKEYLMDKRLITYAPSATVLKHCKSLVRDQHRAFVAVADPAENIRYAKYEAKTVANLFEVKEHEKATRRDIIDGARDAHILHYAGHSDGEALRLHADKGGSEEDLYDIGDIFVNQHLPEAWLVTLSACDTGQIQVGLVDEYIGLPSRFLYAGAATVICSLWRASDVSTTILMTRMYRLIKGGLGKAEALAEAQRWLKNSENREEHLKEMEDSLPLLRPVAESLLPKDLSNPYYWAGFICTGAS